MQVCDGSGNSTTFKCPYHHWNYALDGRLLGAPAMERTEGFDKKDFPLPSLRVEVWKGFVFVNMDADAAPLGPDARRRTSRTSRTTSSTTRCAPARSRSPTFRGTGR